MKPPVRDFCMLSMKKIFILGKIRLFLETNHYKVVVGSIGKIQSMGEKMSKIFRETIGIQREV